MIFFLKNAVDFWGDLCEYMRTESFSAQQFRSLAELNPQ